MTLKTVLGWWGAVNDPQNLRLQRPKPHPWRMVCHNCGERYPINGAGARDCCATPSLRLHDLSAPCDWCDDEVRLAHAAAQP